MEKIQDLSAYTAANVSGVPAEPAVDPRSKQIEEAIRRILVERGAW